MEDRLRKSFAITLVLDIWTNAVMSDFLGLAAVLKYELRHNEILIIGLKPMNGKHDSVSIQKAVEFLVNQYDFDKSKINCMFIRFKISNSIFQSFNSQYFILKRLFVMKVVVF